MPHPRPAQLPCFPPPTRPFPNPTSSPPCRVAEEEIFGPDGASLSTGRELGLASELARWLVVDSTLHPDYRNTVLRSNMTLGGYPDPTTEVRDGGGGREGAVFSLGGKGNGVLNMPETALRGQVDGLGMQRFPMLPVELHGQEE